MSEAARLERSRRQRRAAPGSAHDRLIGFLMVSRLPVFSLDRIYMRGFRCEATMVPRGTGWARMSDHLPYVAELELIN